MFRKLLVAASTSAPIYLFNSSNFRTYLEEEIATRQFHQTPIEIEDNGEDEDDTEWMVEKEKCSFCKQFLQSPCKIPFRRWSKCVDKAKEENLEFVGACFKYTGALIDCTTNNEAYFKRMDGDDEDDDVIDDNEDDVSTTTHKEEVQAGSHPHSEPEDNGLFRIPEVVQDLAENSTTSP